jgi:hypothetical protein
VSQDHQLPLTKIISNVPKKVTPSTGRKAFHGLGFYSCIVAKEPFLNKKQRAVRPSFVKRHKDWTIDDTKHIIWTNKLSFKTRKILHQIKVWQKPIERCNPARLAPIFKSKRTSIMAWGPFIDNQTLSLVIMLSEYQTAVDFVKIIYEPILGP